MGVLSSHGLASHWSTVAAWRRSAAASLSTAADAALDASFMAIAFSLSPHSALAERQIPRARSKTCNVLSWAHPIASNGPRQTHSAVRLHTAARIAGLVLLQKTAEAGGRAL